MIDLERNAACEPRAIGGYEEEVKMPANIVFVARKQDALADIVGDERLNFRDVRGAGFANLHRAVTRRPTRSCSFSRAPRTDSTDVPPGTRFLRIAASSVTAEK